ncbi:hypothetical protein GCM10010287_05750 [Streptomyces variabilis]|uniref:Uncharacterized protein n=1 Tax=Streptomyces variabilis TaxID=67372 RepID=A0ABQ2TTD1_9ACTN|nr:hypothetical protein GCM10010265_35820 [Streptomyces griseoincarnatus]GGT35925.1 hypothetical protein GCM10010287_05750 [Streptomyces variabilis]
MRTRSSRKASGATVRQRCQASSQEVPDLRVRVGGIRFAPLSVHGREIRGLPRKLRGPVSRKIRGPVSREVNG